MTTKTEQHREVLRELLKSSVATDLRFAPLTRAQGESLTYLLAVTPNAEAQPTRSRSEAEAERSAGVPCWARDGE